MLLRAQCVPMRIRLLLSLALGCLAATMTARETAHVPGPRDFGQVWFAARSVLQGVDPYPLVGPSLTFEWGSPLVYPLPAALIAIPFTPFAEPVASMLFAAVGGAVFAWVLMAYGYGPLFGFFSLAMREASAAAQWSPIVSACFVLAPLSFILIAKPTIGAALFVARPSWWAVAGGVALLSVSFLVQPTWIADWLGAVQQYREMGAPNAPYRAVVSFPGGVWLCSVFSAGDAQKRDCWRRWCVFPSHRCSTRRYPCSSFRERSGSRRRWSR